MLKSHFIQRNFDGMYGWAKMRIPLQGAQKGRPAMPQPMKAPEA